MLLFHSVLHWNVAPTISLLCQIFDVAKEGGGDRARSGQRAHACCMELQVGHFDNHHMQAHHSLYTGDSHYFSLVSEKLHIGKSFLKST